MKSTPRGILAIVPPYSLTGPPAGMAYLLGTLKAHGVEDIGFVDLRLTSFEWPELSYNSLGTFGENFVIDVPDLPLVLHLLRSFPETDIWDDFENLPWAQQYCYSRSIPMKVLGTSLRATQSVLREWAKSVDGLAIAGFTTWVTNYLSTLMAAAELKRLSAPPFVVLGGPQCSDSEVAAELALASGMADAVVIGEGEQSFLELQARIDAASRSLSGPPPAGVKIWRNGGLEFGGRRPLLRLEDLALPYYDEMNLDAYSRRHRQIIFQLSRGCTDRCEFCSEWVFWERFRSATPESAMDQLRELQRRTRFDHIMFSDSLLNADHKRLVAFAEARLASDYRFSWSGFARAQMDKVTAELLFRAGFKHVFIGVESMSDSTLEKMNKRRTVRDNMDAIENCLNAGIEVVAGVVAGFPGDSRDEFLHTMKVLKEYMQRYPGKISVSLEPFVVTPSAPVFRRCKEHRLSLIPWPEEILETAPIFAPIARRCMARVEGPDQTAERSGRYRYARMMTSDSSAHAVAA